MFVSMRRGKWLAAVASVAVAGAASAQAPVRAVYVNSQDGKPGVYTVTGIAPPDKLPPIAAPVGQAPIALPPGPLVPGPLVPGPLPPGAMPHPGYYPTAPAIGTPVNCPTGHCGHGGKHGATSYWTCLWTPATVPPPLGASVRGAFDMQRDNALGEYFVIYREDWLDATLSLNVHGARHLDGIVRRLGIVGAPVKLEPTGNPALDAQRMTAIVEQMVQAGVPPLEAGRRVVYGTTRAEGLRYHDIDALYNRTGGTGGSNYGGGGGYGGMGGGMGGFGGGMGGFGGGFGGGMGGFGY
ncbi:MAG TPA: hypothetical protein VN641_11795 [Urbifossiella sp.]|nr:hypothetical protein [Urbifossiella sp.]